MKTNEAILALRDAQLSAGHLYNTRKTYRGWLLSYIKGTKSGHFRDLQGFLDHLTTRQQLNPKTVRQALNALAFFYKNVLKTAPGKLRVPKINKNKNTPTWLHHQEAVALLSRMKGTARLQTSLLYGTGSRIHAMLTLRLKDIDLAGGLITFHFDKGGKSRTVKLPKSLIPELRQHIEYIRGKWETDNRNGIAAPHPEPSLMKKLGRKTFTTLPWYWLFPSQVITAGNRWHATDRGLCKAIAKAAREEGLTKRVTAHTFRHSHATALLQQGVNIRQIQTQLGHTHLDTTEIYTHATASELPDSPLDQSPSVIHFPPPPETRRIG